MQIMLIDPKHNGKFIVRGITRDPVIQRFHFFFLKHNVSAICLLLQNHTAGLIVLHSWDTCISIHTGTQGSGAKP